MGHSRFTVEQEGVAIRCQPQLDAAPLFRLELGDEFAASEVIIEHGIEWVKLPKGSTATRINGKTSEISLNPSAEGFVPVLDPELGTVLKRQGIAKVVVDERKEEGALSKREIAEILEQSSDPDLMLPLESKYWTKQQLQMFVMSGGSIRPAWCSIPDERLMANTNMTKEEIMEALMQAADWIANADAILIGSGAGMGVDSGLGTFRGSHKGVWAGLEAVGLAYEEICQPRWFTEEPHLGWGFWNFCHEAYQATVPHEGYSRVREWGQRCPLGFFSFTSNIDSHWVASGTPGANVLEVHGAVKWLQCSKSCAPDVWKAPKDLKLEEDEVTHRVKGILPTCPKCKAVARPNVQMFGGDTGFSKARRGAQFSRYDAWLKQLEARPDKDSLRVACIELGCGLTVPTVRNELEGVVRKFKGAKLVRVNPENPGLSNDLAHKGVSLPLKAGLAIEEINKQVCQAGTDGVNFILWGRGACEVHAPYGTCLGRLLRLCEAEEGISVSFSKATKAIVHSANGKQRFELHLDQTVDPSCFPEMKAAEGPQQVCTAVLEVEAAFRNAEGHDVVNSTLKKRIENVAGLLGEMCAKFEEPSYQEHVRQCTTKRQLIEHVRSVQYGVLPKYDMEPSEKGTLVMQNFIGSVQRIPEIGYEVNRSMELSCFKLVAQLPSAAEVQKQAQMEPLQVTCLHLPGEDGLESPDSLQLDLFVGTQIWELRDRLAQTLSWDEDAAQKVCFFEKQGSKSFARLEEGEPVRRTVYVQGSGAFQEAVELQVTFKEMVPEEGQEPLSFVLGLMSDTKVADLRQLVGDALGWDAATRRTAKFLIRMGKESFGGLKDKEQIPAKKVIFVHGASLVPAPGAVPQQEVEEDSEDEEWIGQAEGEIELTIVLDAGMDFTVPLIVKCGETVAAVKRMLADADPTGKTTVDAFWLRPPGEVGSLLDKKRLWENCRLEISLSPPARKVRAVAPRPKVQPAPTPAKGPSRSYFVAGSWLNFKPTEMEKEGACFVHTLKVGRAGYENFQILLGGNWDSTYYPSVKDAYPGKDFQLKGPDNRGHGCNWLIRSPNGRAGSCFKIVVSVDAQQFATNVTWRQIRS